MFNANNNFGIYIHWPYCTHICPYCDFNIYRARGRDNDALLAAIKQELKYWGERKKQEKLTSLYFGGGTPSLLSANQIAELVAICEKIWGFENIIEIVLEANPNEFEIEKFKDFKRAGIERLSLGVQSFSNSGLKDLGRFHSANDAINATKLAREIFPRLSIDLIYARQNQTIFDWEKELKQAIELEIDHLSPYQLTIEPNTAFERKQKRGAIILPNGELAADFYDFTQDFLGQNGFINYEISNHAKSKNSISRHNMLYWQSQEWLGIGPGSHGRINENDERKAILNIANPNDYINSILQKNNAIELEEVLQKEEIKQEYYIMGLRLLDGIKIHNEFKIENKYIEECKALGLIEIENDNIKLLPHARAISNAVISKLLGD